MNVTEELRDQLDGLVMAILDEEGRERLCPVPVRMEVGTVKETLQDQVRRIIHHEMSRQAELQGFETLEEANDLDVDEDPEPFSNYEVKEMIDEVPVVDSQTEVPAEPAGSPSGEAEKAEVVAEGEK